MGLPVTVYRWDDAGAPQLINGKPSEIINILKKCLVEGYGTKAGAGWSIAFEDTGTHKIAFRNSTVNGSGGYVQFWSVAGTDVNSGEMRFRSAKSMAALDTFIGAQYQLQFSVATSVDYWVLLATSVGFWLITNSTLASPYSATNNKACFFIGDIDSFVPNDPGRFVNIMNVGTSDMTSSYWGNSFDASVNANSTLCKIYDTDGSDNFVNYKMDSNYIQGVSASIAGVPVMDRVFSYCKLITTNGIASNDRLGVNNGNSVVQPFHRGFIPGLVNTPSCGYSDQAWPVIENINGHDYMLMPGYLFGRNWVNMEQWYV